MNKGINGWAFAGSVPLADAARQAAEAGFDSFEPTIGRDCQVTPTLGKPECARLGEEVREAGLAVSSTACGMFWEYTFTSRDPGVRAQAFELAVACLERARWLGAPVLLVVPGVVSHFARPKINLTPYSEACQLALDAFQRLASVAEEQGVVIGIENVWNQFLISPVEMREFIDRVNSPWVQAYFDIGNTLRYGFPQDWIRTLGKRIARVHAKDFKMSVGTVEGFCPLGEGDVDWPEVVKALDDVGYDGPVTFEGRGELRDIAERMACCWHCEG